MPLPQKEKKDEGEKNKTARTIRGSMAIVLLTITLFVVLFSVEVHHANASGSVVKGVLTNPVPGPGYGFVDFEEGVDGQPIQSTLPGLKFTTTSGYDWIYIDARTGKYNVQSLTDPTVNYGPYVENGYFSAWLGPDMGAGRIDFVNGNGNYFSILISTYSGGQLDAYDSGNTLIATSGWADGNWWTHTFTRLTVQAPGIAYVMIHDSGNYWLIDDLVADAPNITRPTPYDATIKAYDNSLGQYVNVDITLDGSPTGYQTPHTFTGLLGSHTFTVPIIDSQGNVFSRWNTFQVETTIIVPSMGNYTAYYNVNSGGSGGGVFGVGGAGRMPHID